MANRRILILYSEFMPYNLVVWQVLKDKYSCDLHIVFWDHKKLSPYQYNGNDFTIYPRSRFDIQSLRHLFFEVDPKLIVVSGRMDRSYLTIAALAKSKGIPTVMASDKQWTNSLKDWAGVVLSKALYHQYFSHVWVAGERQEKYALRIGFKKTSILRGVYCCNLPLFQSFTPSGPLSGDVLFIGRLEAVKGVDMLITALEQLRKEGVFRGALRLVGNGSMEVLIPKHEWIIRKSFSDQGDIEDDVANSRIFCLPSRNEPWGVVLHEMAAAGMLLCCSSVCGAGDEFVVHQSNGYVFNTGDIADLKKGLRYLLTLEAQKVIAARELSKVLANRITPEFSANQLMKVLDSCAE